MHKIKLDNEYPKILCLGAHSDDIEIGCGGTIINLVRLYSHIEFYWVIFCSNYERERELYKSFSLFLEPVSKKRINIFDFKDGFLPYSADKVKDKFEKIKREFTPRSCFYSSSR